MSFDLEEVKASLYESVPQLEEMLDSLIQEASHYMNEATRETWLQNAQGIAYLGKGQQVVISYLEAVPQVISKVEDEILDDILETIMKLSSVTSGEVVALMLDSLPLIAERTQDIDLLRQYLALIYQIGSKTPRGLRPMLNIIDDLMSKLTVSGLRRWAQWGAQAHARNFEAQLKYFALESEDSKAVFQQQRKGSLFIDHHRSINFYLRAFWARDFFIRPAAADHDDFKPYFEKMALHLPDALNDLGDIKGVDLYRAMAAHLASHIAYTKDAISMEQLNPQQMFFIELIEDARVEYNAIKNFPGLKNLWMKVIRASMEERELDPRSTAARLEQLALALMDPEFELDDPQMEVVAERFHSQIEDNLDNEKWSWDLGILLYNVLNQATSKWESLTEISRLRFAYRDDNRLVWASEEWAEMDGGGSGYKETVRKYVSVMEMINEIDSEMVDVDHDEVWVLGSEFFPYEDNGISYNEMEGVEPISDPFHYHEWDYRVQLHRPNWVTLYEHRAKKGDPEIYDRILEANKGIAHRIKQIVDKLQAVGLQRIRRLEDGDELDLNACVEAITDIRMGQEPDPRITMKNVIRTREVSVVILLDLSESTNEFVGGEEKTILEVTQEAAILVSHAINGIGDQFAVHGFSSDGRHDVQYTRFKQFDEPFDADVHAKLAGMQGGLSTRMGAAMRHAGHYLEHQSSKQKLLLVITDGEPADIDEKDGQYLKQDAKKAVEELQSKGIYSYCLTIDQYADKYVQNIFGQNRYAIVDDVMRLPEKLPTLFANLTT
ncbi:VWA domain-containing protein [Thiomicrorhabdus sp. zzn3]|uniref:nitric oxide reductase activation protein NorD n=1 Tax=Thiomicrorhabdus sp. zzn3 TaxID=3039775 RepID=UPI00243722EC|nr:VWA domain-containing protein [Thiomicrorhabdus sp. zzn3]MDG6778244.1 VWA domain-containing protein [Thiomicrorhabdus sp. zzn3]